jgi:uncharacterized protein GlcG (DUF336 family)
MKTKFIAGILAFAMMSGGEAAPIRDAVELTAELSKKIIQGCSDHAVRKGQSHAIAVVDRGGALVAFLRMDGNPPGVGDFALQKATATAHWRFSTESMAKAATTTPGFASAPRVVTVAGGVPVYAPDGKTFLGAVGVSGEAPEEDVECAKAGITAAGFQHQRK